MPQDIELTLAGTLTVAALEEQISRQPRVADCQQPLLIDLSELQWVEIPALLHLLSLTSHRVARGLEIHLAVPRSKTVRDLFRRWKYPQALATATGIPFHRLVVPSDLKYFGEQPQHYLPTPVYDSYGSIIDRLESSTFFAFTVHGITATPSLHLMHSEWNKWRDPLIMQVLSNHLSGPGEDIARVVVYESLANALQHPGADLLCTSSKVDRSTAEEGRRSTPRQLTLCCWDNGASIIETLAQCLDRGNPIRAQGVDPVLLTPEFEARFVGGDDTTTTRVISMSWEPTGSSSHGEILLASIFPGITRKASTSVPPVAALHDLDPTQRTTNAAGPGMGLFVLLRTVVDVLQGEIAFRTLDCFMNLKATKTKTGPRYQAKIRTISSAPRFHGNMITIRLPLLHASALESKA